MPKNNLTDHVGWFNKNIGSLQQAGGCASRSAGGFRPIKEILRKESSCHNVGPAFEPYPSHRAQVVQQNIQSEFPQFTNPGPRQHEVPDLPTNNQQVSRTPALERPPERQRDKPTLIARKLEISDTLCDLLSDPASKERNGAAITRLQKERELISRELALLHKSSNAQVPHHIAADHQLYASPKRQDHILQTPAPSSFEPNIQNWHTSPSTTSSHIPFSSPVITTTSTPPAKTAISDTHANRRTESLPLTNQNNGHSLAVEAFPLATDNNLPTFPWSRDARKALTQIFHLKDFRQNQLEAINSTLSGKDCFVLMPTGGGKSLCYQLPACLGSGATSGVTLVISPLLSLIQDQVSKLIGLGITALAICGTHSTEYRQWAYQELESIPPKVKLVYVTPEMVMKSPRFQGLMSDLHRRKALARFVIDEAHCVSQWGHDFRPDYKQLGTLKRDFPGVPILALTATANDKVKADIIYTLDITKCDKYVQSFNRPNLRYEVRKKGTSIVEDMVALIRTHYPSQCGIIYCGSRRACEEVTKKLEQKRLPVAFYHAGLHKDDRQRVQKNWATGSTRIIIATVAFGMGIDKGNVRFVIHYSLPQSIEGYYQETGRAGRDGKESLCILYYAYRDKHIIDMLITKGEGSQEQKDRQKGNLRDMIAFCENDRDCRRQQVLQYFGERFDAQKCNRTCDNCRRVQQNTVVKDVRSDAQAIIAMVTHLQSNSVTMTHCIDIYRGANLKKILALKHNELPWFGKGNTFIRTDIERLFHFLAGKEILTEIVTKNGQGFPYAHVRLGKKAWEYQRGNRPLTFAITENPA